MADNDFTEGRIDYTVDREIPQNLDLSKWRDGYLTFSNDELRKNDKKLQDRNLADLLKGKVKGIEGVEGYLMEVNLWRGNEDGSYEEISIEREDRGFFYQEWKLYPENTSPSEGNHYDCYYRNVETRPRGNSIFKNGDLKSIEVIVPERRLHFFITTGEQDNG